MNCGDWESLIASGESETPELRRHLAECAECRRLADEIGEVRRALASLPEPVIESIQPLVMARVAGGRAGLRWLGAAAAAAAALFIVFSHWPRPAETSRPLPAKLAARTPPIAVPAVKTVESPRLKTPPARSGPMQVKIETNDPNVVIIWLVD